MNATEPSIVQDALAAADWAAKALSSWAYKADFSIESLKEVDRFFDEQASEGQPKPGGHLSRDFGPHMFALGAYVGEAIRRQGDGQWQGNDGDPNAVINLAVRLKSGSTFWPMQRVMKRFKNGAEDGIHVYGILLLRP